MARRTKKVGITGRYGTRYGSSIRKIIKKFDLQQHSKYTCPFCGKVPILINEVPSQETSRFHLELQGMWKDNRRRSLLLEVNTTIQ